jgi:hypothetical protein
LKISVFDENGHFFPEIGHIFGKKGHMPQKNRDSFPFLPYFYPGVQSIFDLLVQQ